MKRESELSERSDLSEEETKRTKRRRDEANPGETAPNVAFNACPVKFMNANE
ncbi:MAG: hypothetical protein R6U19_05895 [Bacteroidales bacterium]